MNRKILLSLAVLLIFPLLFTLPLPEWIHGWAVIGILFCLWGGITTMIWEREVIPIERLHLPPHRTMPGMTTPVVSVEGSAGTAETVAKQFQWHFTPRDGSAMPLEIQMTVNRDRYTEAQAEPRRTIGSWAHYAQAESPEADQLAAAFYGLFQKQPWSSYEKASCVLNFTQACIRYELDQDSTPLREWPRYPVETLMEEVGDCEDDVILTAAVLKRMGWEVVLLYYPGHCALGVAGADHLPGDYVTEPRTGLKYFYGETTATGWYLGDVPPAYRNRTPEGFEVVQRVVG